MKPLDILIAVVILSLTHAGVMWLNRFQQENGFVRGVDFILDQCYNIGGVVVREDKSTIICNRGSPLSDAEFNEIKPLLTKKEEWHTLQN